MKKTVKEVSDLSGISVRTLHYYDQIDLLKPSEITESGYRLYDKEDLDRLQQILFLKELDFRLMDIKNIIDNPDYSKSQALEKHRELLILKKQRLDRLIKLIEKTLKGECEVSFSEFDMSEITQAQKEYKEETEKLYGGSDSYKESKRRTDSYNEKDWEKITTEAREIYRSFANHIGEDPSSPEVQQLVLQWQQHITKYYYECTKEILAGLGQMYVGDERFMKNIDKYGEGTALLMSSAIEFYCR